jgi:peptidoglycan/xylan/chitin deacetylase (PgdA/CDA1 family)
MNNCGSSAAVEIGPTSIRRQDLLCLSLYYLGFSRIRNLVLRWRSIPVVRILVFHDVLSSQACSFREKLEIIKEMANVVSLDDIFDDRLSLEKINIAITFDDGFRGWVDSVCTILRDLGMNATFFVSSGFVGLQKDEEQDFLRNNLRNNRQTSGSLTTEDLKKLAGQGFTIGGHTCNHVNLAEICDLNELCNEIQKDKIELERIAGTKVKYFSYPFGSYRNACINLENVLKDIGYRGAVTVVPGSITKNTNRYYLHRDIVSASMPMTVFKSRLFGNYDGVKIIRKLLRLDTYYS